jgi:hypothetical protein
MGAKTKEDIKKMSKAKQYTAFFIQCLMMFIFMVIWIYVGSIFTAITLTKEGLAWQEDAFPSDISATPYQPDKNPATNLEYGAPYDWLTPKMARTIRMWENTGTKPCDADATDEADECDGEVSWAVYPYMLLEWVVDTIRVTFATTRGITKKMLGTVSWNPKKEMPGTFRRFFAMFLGPIIAPIIWIFTLIAIPFATLMSIPRVKKSALLFPLVAMFAFPAILLHLGIVGVNFTFGHLLSALGIYSDSKNLQKYIIENLHRFRHHILFIFLALTSMVNPIYLSDTTDRIINNSLTGVAGMYLLKIMLLGESAKKSSSVKSV